MASRGIHCLAGVPDESSAYMRLRTAEAQCVVSAAFGALATKVALMCGDARAAIYAQLIASLLKAGLVTSCAFPARILTCMAAMGETAASEIVEAQNLELEARLLKLIRRNAEKREDLSVTRGRSWWTFVERRSEDAV